MNYRRSLKILEQGDGYAIRHSGQGYSVLEMVSAIEKASGKKVSYKIVGRRSGDAQDRQADGCGSQSGQDW